MRRRRRLKRRLFWTALFLALALVALAGIILRAVESLGSAARRAAVTRRGRVAGRGVRLEAARTTTR